MLLNLSEGFSFVIVLIVFAWLGAITFLLAKILRTFTRLTKGVSEKDLKTVLEEILDGIKKTEGDNKKLADKIEELGQEGTYSYQKIGLVRYNPFGDTGGNQSFVLALLDGNDNGFVITSLHSRDSTRVFAKPVKEGHEVGFEFSKEEVQAIVAAQKREKFWKK